MEKDWSVLEAKNHRAFDIPWHFDYNYLKDFVYYKFLFEAMSEFFRNEIHKIVPLLPVLLNVFVVPSVAPTAG